MATTFTTLLKLAKPTQGELDGSWGTVVNDNITSMVEEAIAGRSVINTWSTNSHTLTTANGTTAESRAAMLSLTDTNDQLGTNAATVVCPALSKVYIVKNAVGQAATLKTASGTGIAIPNGKTMILFCDGTNVEEAVNNFTGTITTAAITASGAITSTGDITAAGTLLATGDTSAGDDAAVGYTAAEGLILTGQGSTNDVTIKNDADADVIEIPTGTTQVDMAGDVTVGDDLTLKSDASVLGFGVDTDTTLTHVADTGVLLNSTRKIQFNDASQFIQGSSATVLSLGATDEIDLTATAIDINGTVDVSGNSVLASVDVTGIATAATFEPDGDTAAGDNAAIGYTAAEGLILTGQGSTNDVTIKNDADADVLEIPTGTTNVTVVGNFTASGNIATNGSQSQWSKGSDVASNSALAVGTDGNYFDVTGTTTITSINTTGGAGTVIKLHFDGACQLTHSGTNLILAGAQNFTTEAGDELEFVEYGSGTYRQTGWCLAGTTPGGGGGGAFLGEGASGSSVGNSGDIIRVNEAILNTSQTMVATDNGSCTGPFSIASGVTLTLASGATFVVI